jgi:hypothetical protein
MTEPLSDRMERLETVTTEAADAGTNAPRITPRPALTNWE